MNVHVQLIQDMLTVQTILSMDVLMHAKMNRQILAMIQIPMPVLGRIVPTQNHTLLRQLEQHKIISRC